MSAITESLADYLKELDSYMNRLNSDGLSRTDRKLFFEMSNEYYGFFKESAGEYAFPPELLGEMEAFIDNMINHPKLQKDLAGQHYEAIGKMAGDYIESVERRELQMRVFRNDAEIIKLQAEKIQMMQELADLEIKRDGMISKETAEILEVQHCELSDGKVREIPFFDRESHEQEKREEPESGIQNISVRVTPYEKAGSTIRGLASIRFEGLAVENIAIHQGKDKLFVSMPSYRTNRVDGQGKPIYKEVCHPATAGFRAKLHHAILQEYENVRGQERTNTKDSVIGKLSGNKGAVGKQGKREATHGKDRTKTGRDEMQR